MGREQMKVLLINGSPHHHFLPKIKEKPNIPFKKTNIGRKLREGKPTNTE